MKFRRSDQVDIHIPHQSFATPDGRIRQVYQIIYQVIKRLGSCAKRLNMNLDAHKRVPSAYHKIVFKCEVATNNLSKNSSLRLCLRVLRGRKGKAKEGKGRKGREGRKEGKPSPCLGVKKPIRKGDGGFML
ncbi:hypothetical protein MTR_0136s0020 [Medicago truncatula]|uniref:Uncharacterized protein n=1 Tax=Medicago truncatula TaxID=3880 RepID=A0A072TSR1_MEDTR|nr:hypothetical protein MTR_0136s0020 [Medicago truncatula]